jgi:hypothetical protein
LIPRYSFKGSKRFLSISLNTSISKILVKYLNSHFSGLIKKKQRCLAGDPNGHKSQQTFTCNDNLSTEAIQRHRPNILHIVFHKVIQFLVDVQKEMIRQK